MLCVPMLAYVGAMANSVVDFLTFDADLEQVRSWEALRG